MLKDEDFVERDSDGLVRCPNCGAGMSFESAAGRDLETMGGKAIEYVVCDHGCGQFEVIDGKVFPC